jgi:hypothetical protein
VVAYSGSARPARPARRLNAPRPALVEGHADGTPRRVNRQDVAVVREEWRVVDRWWTDQPVQRRYFDVVLESGENAVVFYDDIQDDAIQNLGSSNGSAPNDSAPKDSAPNDSAPKDSEVGRWYSQRA